MTRETKIGLLVGLGFIILFGLILGRNHGGAPAAQTGPQVRVPMPTPGLQGVLEHDRQLASRQPDAAPPVRPPVPDVDPPQQVIGDRAPPAPEPVIEIVQPPAPPVEPTERLASVSVNDRAEAARLLERFRSGRTEIGNGPSVTDSHATPAGDQTAAPTLRPGEKLHVVKAGETLFKISLAYYGSGKHYHRIFEANRGWLSSENSLAPGQELVIPTLEALATPASPAGPAAPAPVPSRVMPVSDSTVAPAPRPATTPAPAPARPAAPAVSSAMPRIAAIVPPAPAPAPSPVSGALRPVSNSGSGTAARADLAGRTEAVAPPPPPAARALAAGSQQYRVVEGDTLSRIARKRYQDDSVASIRKIYDANRDKLRDPHQLQVGMVLAIPQ